jgi:hypothetical protein
MGKKEAILFWLFAVAVTTCPLPQAKGQAKDKPADANISGVWTLTFTNKQTQDLTFVQDKQALKVTLKLPDIGAVINGTGTIKADVAEWTLTLSSPLRSLKWIYRAKVEGDTMSGEVQLGDARTTKWTASKKKDLP